MYTVPYHPQAFTGTSNAYGLDRSVTGSEQTMSAGNLNKINNAYGGSIAFQYELHTGLTNVISNLPTSDPLFLAQDANDGLRLKAVVETDKFHPGDNRTTLFNYSGGQRFLTGGYFTYPSSKDNITHAITAYTSTGAFVSPHQLVNGSNHGYSQVTVEVHDGTTALVSKTVYNFTNFKDGTNLRMLLNGPSSRNYFQAPYTDKQYIRDWELGLPLMVTQYDENNKMVSRTTNHYNPIINTVEALNLQTNVRTMRVAPSVSRKITLQDTIATDSYLPYTGIALLDTTITEKFVSNNIAVTDTVTFGYDNRNNLIKTRTRNSRGQYIYNRNVYNYEVSGPGVFGGSQTGTDLYNMSLNGIEKVVSVERWKEMPGTQPFSNVLLDASVTGYRYQNGKIWLNQLQTLESVNPVGYTAYTGATQGGPQVNPYGKILAVYNTTTPVTNLKQATEVQSYDSKGNPLETKLLDEEVYKAMIWDTVRGSKLAEVSNARYADIGCTSFENTIYGVAYTGNENIVNGNFYYKQFGVSTEDSVTGGYCYKLSSAGQAAVVSTAPLTVGKEYLITFWAKNGTPALSGAGLSSITLTGGYTSQGWTFYQARFTPTQATAVNFATNTTLFLDELRLMPSNSTMNSWTYDPFFGTKTATDATGRVSRYQYDPLGRQNTVRDQDGNILSRTEFHVSQ